jgi:hypothetical protein
MLEENNRTFLHSAAILNYLCSVASGWDFTYLDVLRVSFRLLVLLQLCVCDIGVLQVTSSVPCLLLSSVEF